MSWHSVNQCCVNLNKDGVTAKEEGEMIACEDDSCPIEWFHTSCLKLSNIPRGKWFCPDCRKKKTKERGGKKKKV